MIDLTKSKEEVEKEFNHWCKDLLVKTATSQAAIKDAVTHIQLGLLTSQICDLSQQWLELIRPDVDGDKIIKDFEKLIEKEVLKTDKNNIH